MNAVLAAEHFGVHRRSIHNWVKDGFLAMETVGTRKLVVVPDDFEPPRLMRRTEKTGRVAQVLSVLGRGRLAFWQLAERMPGSRRAVSSAVCAARERGLIESVNGEWSLTAKGRDLAA